MNEAPDIHELVGERISLRPLHADDFEAVYQAASDPLIWEMHPEPTRYQESVFRDGFFASAVRSGSAFVITENATGAVIGSSRYYDWNPARQEIAIGYTFLVRRCWGGTFNAELKHLMLAHAFRWAKVVWFHIGSDNWRSRRATEKIGAVFSHEENREVHGVNFPTAFYRIDAPTNESPQSQHSAIRPT